MGPAAGRYAMKPVAEPDAGNRHVRFDERGWETGRLAKPQATASILDSTHSTRATSRNRIETAPARETVRRGCLRGHDAVFARDHGMRVHLAASASRRRTTLGWVLG